MNVTAPPQNSLSRYLKKLLNTKPKITDLYLFNVDCQEISDLDVNVHDCSSNLEASLSQLAQKRAKTRLFVAIVNEEEIQIFQSLYLSAYFFEACFFIPLSWECLFVDWSPRFSTEQEDPKGVFRNATLNTSLPASITLTTPNPSQLENCQFTLDHNSRQNILIKCNRIPLFPSDQKFTVHFDPLQYQYFITFHQKGLISKIIKKSLYFLIRDLTSAYHGSSADSSALKLLKIIHALGYMSLDSDFSTANTPLHIKSRFSYFESGFKIHSINRSSGNIDLSENYTAIFASKCPIQYRTDT